MACKKNTKCFVAQLCNKTRRVKKKRRTLLESDKVLIKKLGKMTDKNDLDLFEYFKICDSLGLDPINDREKAEREDRFKVDNYVKKLQKVRQDYDNNVLLSNSDFKFLCDHLEDSVHLDEIKEK